MIHGVAGVRHRYVWDDCRIFPEVGDLARVLEDVSLEGGGVLPVDQNVQITSVVGWPPTAVGVRWRDKDGTHIMALAVEQIEVVA